SPRVHPVSPLIAGGGLYVYMEPTSPKCHDLRRDARYSLHCAVEDQSGGAGEFLVSGRAAEVTDEKRRAELFEAARAIGYNPQDRYVLFELSVEEAKSTTYEDDAPRRARWKSS
ncbi:MAG TPA: pyridoxamine 5'-phosphate oxidase, partial [Blastocatellia bacterium]|nr:pyridoxamine 5'-phosphate oxidase [Blastocatellia bacterium]